MHLSFLRSTICCRESILTGKTNMKQSFILRQANPKKPRSNFAIGMAFLTGLAFAVWGGLLPVDSANAQSRSRTAKSNAELPEQVKKIDEFIRQTWKDYEMKPSAPAEDSIWCRRLYLDLLGRIPTVEELDTFLSNRSRNRRAELVAKLLYDEEYTEEYARNWTTLWTNILIGRSGGTERNSLTSREGMQKYLRDSFARNKPYDKMVYELVSATGTTTPGSPKFNGATNFLVMKVNEEKASQATAATSKIFLGLQVQCTQCHNHPFNDWKQQKYWEMNAFFRQTRALRRFTPGTRNVSGAELVDQDFAGEDNFPQEARVFYELRNGETRMALPKFVDGTEINPTGYVSDVNRRAELAKMIVKSPFMDKTIVNRMWSHFLGYGFTKPIDDLGPHNQPSHPDLMEYLAREFRGHSYDLKQLITWITLSEAYSLSSRANSSNRDDDPQLGESPKFTHFYLRQMRAEELYESLLVATQAAETRGNYQQQERDKSQWLQQFVTQFGTDEGDETTSFNGTIPQVLMMFNGGLVKQAVNARNGSFLSKVVNSRLSRQKKLEYLSKAAFSRKPTKEELNLIGNEVLAAYNGNEVELFTDIWWSMLNSNEFIFNH